MQRQRRFRQDFEDIHGRGSWADVDVEIIRHEDIRAGRIVTGVDSPGLRLVIGALGLFWAIVLIGVLVVMIVVAWAMISSLGAPPIQT
jgi:hypothetical protein